MLDVSITHLDTFKCVIFLPITAKFVLSEDLLSCLNAKSHTEQEET